MAQIRGNYEEFERFSYNLRSFGKDMQDTITRVKAQFAGLDDTWDEQKKQQFTDELQQAVTTLHRIAELAEEQSTYLWNKAQDLRRFTEH